jgi:hypothetical protein
MARSIPKGMMAMAQEILTLVEALYTPRAVNAKTSAGYFENDQIIFDEELN